MKIPARHHKCKEAVMVCDSLGRPNGTAVRSWLDFALLLPRDRLDNHRMGKARYGDWRVATRFELFQPGGRSRVANDTSIGRE